MKRICPAIVGLLVVSVVGGVSLAADEPRQLLPLPGGEAQDDAAKPAADSPAGSEAVRPEVLQVRNVDPDDSEERQLLTQRLNVARELLSVMNARGQGGMIDQHELLEASREVFQTEMRLAETTEERLEAAERLLEVAEQMLESQQARVRIGAGITNLAELHKAELAVIDAKLEIATIKSEADKGLPSAGSVGTGHCSGVVVRSSHCVHSPGSTRGRRLRRR